MAGQYIKAKTFEDFKENQDTLISLLNHNMTKLGKDVEYIKLYLKWFIGISTVIGTTFIISVIL